MYQVRTISPFKDLEDGNRLRNPGEVFWINSDERLLTLLGDNQRKQKFIEVIRAKKKCSNKYEGNKIVIHQGYLYYIGGIETFLYNLTKNYKDRNITIVCEMIEPSQLINLSKYADIVIAPIGKIECDIMILGNYDGHKILPRVKAKKVYQMIHADLDGMRKAIPGWENLQWTKDPRVDEVICVSEAAQKGLEAVSGYKAKVIYNILDDDYKEENGLIFITMSRATVEKGIKRIIQMAKKFKESNKRFTWFLCCSLDQADRKLVKEIDSIPEFIVVPPSVDNKKLIRGCDYLVQLSDTESFCYSAFEALQREVPVILTDFPEAYNIIDDGENGYIIKKDLSNLDVDKIFNEIPSAKYYIDRCNHDSWEKVFKGEF